MNRTPLRSTSLILFSVAAAAAQAFSQSTDGPRPGDPPTSNGAIQRFHAEHNPRFQTFMKRHPGAWIPTFDEETGSPLSIVGRGIVVSPRPIVNITKARALAEEFIKSESYFWGAPVDELVLDTEIEAGQLYIFTWKQVHDGLDVLGARADVQIHKSGRICMFGTSAVEIAGNPRSNIKINAQDAVQIVKKGKIIESGDVFTVSDLAIFNKRGRGAAGMSAVFVVSVSQPSKQIAERVLVDAENGNIVEVRSLIHNANDVHGQVSGNALLGLSPSAGTSAAALANVKITVNSNSGASASAYTNQNGQFLVNMPDAGPHTATLTLQGPYFTIVDAGGNNISVSGAATPDGSGGFLVNLDANAAPAEETTAQVSAAALHTLIRNYLISKIPSYTAAFPQQTVVVNEASICNAYFDTSNDSIHFFHSGGSCVNTCYSTVMYHEFGHGVDEYYGHILSAGLSEGVADMIAMYFTKQPLIGADFYGSGTAIRTGENGTTWPASNCNYEPHCLGETYMGFAWLARKNLIQTLGETPGSAVAETVILASVVANSVSIPLAVQQAFLFDDNDGDLTNGTPHFTEISAAAIAKGFNPPVAIGLNITHLAHPDTAGQTRDYPVIIDITNQPGSSVGSVHVDYSDNDGANWNTLNATLTSVAGRYKSNIPAHTGPAVIHYRLVVSNSIGATVTLPEGDDAYRFAVGAKTTILFDNFESGAAGWTHGALAGNDDWVINDPSLSSAAPLLLDPPFAYSGTRVAGTDLSVGGKDGFYEANVNTYLESPAVSGVGYNNLRLRFRRWLSVEGSEYDHARVLLTSGANATIWTNAFQPEHIDTAWTLQDAPIAAANGASQFKIQFALDSDGGLEFGGWNIDDVDVYHLGATPPGTFTLSVNSINPPIGSLLTFNSAGDSGAYFEIYVSGSSGPVAVDGFGVAEVGPDAAFFYNGFLDNSGHHSISFELPNNPIFVGFEIDAIGYEIVPGGLPQLGNAVKIVIS